jgi:hypothetical protein
MIETFFKSFLFIPLELLLWLVGLTLIPSGFYFIKTQRSVSAKAKPPAEEVRKRHSPRPRDKSDFKITVETGEPVRRKGLWLIIAGGACLAAFVALFILFLVLSAYTPAELIALMIGVALLVPVAWYFGTPPKSSG